MKNTILLILFPLCLYGQSVTISTAVFSGSGLNDATSGGSFSSPPENHYYTATIASTGTPDTVTFSRDGGTATGAVNITGSAQRMIYPAGTVTAASCAGGLITYTDVGHGLSTGSQVTVSGASPSGYNVVNASVLYISSSQFSVVVGSCPAAWSSGGTVIGNDGVTITWTATTGHTAANLWTVTVTANGSSVSFVQQGNGAIVTRSTQDKMRDTFDLRDFGGLCDGVTDNSSAWNKASTAASLQVHGKIILPPGNCYFATPMTITDVNDGLLVEGAGTVQGIRTQGTIISGSSTTSDVMLLQSVSTNLQNITLRNLTVEGPGSGTGHACIEMDATNFTTSAIVFDNVTVTGCAGHGLYAHTGAGTFIFNIIMTNFYGYAFTGNGVYATGNVAQFKMLGSSYIDSTSGISSVLFDGGSGGTISGLTFESPVWSGATTDYCAKFWNSYGITITGIWEESCAYGQMQFKSSRGVVIEGGNIIQAGTAFGIGFSGGASGTPNDTYRINVPWWTNTSTQKYLQFDGSITNQYIRFEDVAGRHATPTDITGTIANPTGIPGVEFLDPATVLGLNPTTGNTYLQMLGFYSGTQQVELGDGTDGAHVDGPMRVDGGLTHASGGFKVCNTCTGAAVINYIYTGVGSSLTFASALAGTCVEQNLTVVGATATNMGLMFSPRFSINPGLAMSAYVSASGVVTIRLCNVTGSPITPTVGDWAATVFMP